MDMRHEWYLFINENIKEGVNFINFHMIVSLHNFCSDVSDGAFNIEILYMSIVIEFYESGALWKVAGGWHILTEIG